MPGVLTEVETVGVLALVQAPQWVVPRWDEKRESCIQSPPHRRMALLLSLASKLEMV